MELKVKCPYCWFENVRDVEDYDIDISHLTDSGIVENLYDRCCSCQESYSFDVAVKFRTNAFRDV